MITKETAFAKAFSLKKEALKEKTRLYDMMLNSAYSTESRLSEIDRECSLIGAKLATAVLNGANVLDDLKKQSAALQLEKRMLLEKADVKPIEYDCPCCLDTGYIGGKICDCIKKIAAAVMIEDFSNEMPLDKSGFENFNLNYYSDKDGSDGNPRRRMTAVLKVCTEYVLNFDPKKSHNLLFLGSAGLGKTHLTLAIVSGLIKKGFMPIYGSAENLFMKIEKEKFAGENRGVYESMLDCDLLVIDDLGAEMETKFTKSALYNLVNSRLLSGKPTIINTNLSMKEIESRYTARISSRLIGCFDAYKFIGDDIRQQKAMEKIANKG